MFRQLSAGKLLIAAAFLFLGGCASLPSSIERTESRALTDTAGTNLAQASDKLRSTQPDANAFRPLSDGVDALLARIILAESAERSLDVQYYIWHDDLTGRHVAAALLRAADRGVRVRILLDDVGVGADDENLLALSAHKNIEIRLFNPVASRTFRGLSFLGDFSRLNRRMHNKAFIADNQAAILGGRNIGDEYFWAHGEVAFGDLDVLMMGPTVRDVSAAFDDFWSAEASVPVLALLGKRADSTEALARLRSGLDEFLQQQRDSPYVTAASTRSAALLRGASGDVYYGKAYVLYDDPAKVSRPPEEAHGRLISQFGNFNEQIQRELLIVSPYFVPGRAGVEWLTGLVQRGVRVTVLTNSLAATDVSAVYAGYQHYRADLLEAGVKLYELRPDAFASANKERKRGSGASRASLHAKTFIFDRRAVFIGSLNLDPRSVQLNTEIGVVCDSQPMAEIMASEIEKSLDRVAWRLEQVPNSAGIKRVVWKETGPDALVRQHDSIPGVGLWKRFSTWVLSLLPIESQI